MITKDTTTEELKELFGDVEDYYSAEEAEEKRAAWEASRTAVASSLADFIASRDEDDLLAAKREESQWGDTPLCDMVASSFR